MEIERKELLGQEQQQGLSNQADTNQPDDGDVDVDVDIQDVERSDSGFCPNYKDHFLLQQPTSDVRFRGNAIRVYQLRSSQLQLVAMTTKKEDVAGSTSNETARRHVNADLESTEHSPTIEMKEVLADRVVALSLLRTTYTLVALFFTGIVSSPLIQFALVFRLRSMEIALTVLFFRIFLAVRL
jgi:hypothetical protein